MESNSITFEIKPHHVANGTAADCENCMVALAIKEVVGQTCEVRVIDNEEIKIDGIRYCGRKVLNELINQFDKLGNSFTFAENYKPVYTLELYDQSDSDSTIPC